MYDLVWVYTLIGVGLKGEGDGQITVLKLGGYCGEAMQDETLGYQSGLYGLGAYGVMRIFLVECMKKYNAR